MTGLVIMPAGVVLAISLPAGLEAFTGHFIAIPIGWLVGLAAFFAELPGAGVLVRPPGFVVLALLVSSVFAMWLLRLPFAVLGGVPGLFGGVLWMYAEDPMGVLLGMSRNKPLVLIKMKIRRWLMVICPTLRVIWPHAGWDDTSSIMCLPIARVTAGINFPRVFR